MQYEISTHSGHGHRTIRNICITDCTLRRDYYRILHLCGDYANEIEALYRIDNASDRFNSITPNAFLFDDKCRSGFMYFWTSNRAPTPDTHHFMTVQEFYDLFDPAHSTTAPYEYW